MNNIYYFFDSEFDRPMFMFITDIEKSNWHEIPLSGLYDVYGTASKKFAIMYAELLDLTTVKNVLSKSPSTYMYIEYE